MRELEAVYWIWWRELRRYTRDKSRVLSSFIQPILFLVVLGSGFGFVKISDLSYQTFLFPGIVAISLVGISIATGISVIWDREFGFLKEILVAPVSRNSIFLGKALGGCTIALIQGILILCLSFFFGINLDFPTFFSAVFVMVLISLGLVSIGLIIASFLETMEGFGLIMNFLIMPLMFLSAAFFPLDQVPSWLRTASLLDPLTYGVDALRQILIKTSFIPFHVDLLVLSGFSLAAILIGGIAFNRQK
ncbi:MAG: ABC transporter permease [Candidatus Aenigmatarchaeota archaeon]